jgi:hypothetical protein
MNEELKDAMRISIEHKEREGLELEPPAWIIEDHKRRGMSNYGDLRRMPDGPERDLMVTKMRIADEWLFSANTRNEPLPCSYHKPIRVEEPQPKTKEFPLFMWFCLPIYDTWAQNSKMRVDPDGKTIWRWHMLKGSTLYTLRYDPTRTNEYAENL